MALCPVRVGAATGLGDDSVVSKLGKEDAAHYHTLCESPSPVGKDIPLSSHDKTPCGLGSPQSFLGLNHLCKSSADN